VSVQAAFEVLNKFDRLTKRDFDAIAHRFGVDPDDDALVLLLIEAGWVHTIHAEELGYEYIREVPELVPWNRFTAVLR